MTHEQIALLQTMANDVIVWSEGIARHEGDLPARSLEVRYQTYRLNEILVPMELNGLAKVAARLEKAVEELCGTARDFDDLCGQTDVEYLDSK